MITVREARPGDEPAILDCHIAAIEARGPDAYDDEQVAAWATKDDPDYHVAEDGYHVVVAEDEADGVVGFGCLVVDEPEVRAVYVHPGRDRQGVGTALLAALEATAQDRGIDRLRLWASLNAVGFYERHGYEEVETVTLDKRGVPFDCVEMARRL